MRPNKMMEEYDVVIIGAGLAGLQCARLLGRSGFRILLVDRKQSVRLSTECGPHSWFLEAIQLLHEDIA